MHPLLGQVSNPNQGWKYRHHQYLDNHIGRRLKYHLAQHSGRHQVRYRSGCPHNGPHQSQPIVWDRP